MTDTTATAPLTGRQLIGFADPEGTEDEFAAVDPRTGATLEPTYRFADPDEVARATTLAAEAFPVYRETSQERRAAFLDQIADNIEALGETLVDRVEAETGIPAARVQGERARTVNQLRLFGRVVRDGSWLGARVEEALPDRTPLPRPDLRQRRIPLGPVAVFGASNFPLAFSVAGGDTAAALAAGAPVVCKAHEAHPGTSELVGRAIQAAVRQHDLPEGTFSMLYGAGPVVGTALATDPRIKAVAFTGSRRAGLALVEAAASRPQPIPVYAEMSSVNPVFLLPGALATRAGDLGSAFVASLSMGIGQLCTSPGLVFAVEGPGLDEFVDAAAAEAAQTPAAPMLTAGIQRAFAEGVENRSQLTDVRSLAHGREAQEIACPGRVHLFETTGEAFLSDPGLQAEVFGATSLVVRVESAEQLLRIVDALEGQLTGTIHAEEEDYEVARPLLAALELKAGRLVFNGWPTGVDVGDAMVHGGPFPATSDARTTSVGTLAIERFLRPVVYQDVPAELLPSAVAPGNPAGIPTRFDGELARR